MGLIDFILNVAGVLLWINWRAGRMDPMNRAVPATLAGTLRRAEPPHSGRWHMFVGLALLILVRAVLYWKIAGTVDWTPKLNLGFLTPTFSTYETGIGFWRGLLYSTLSFTRILLVFYFWLLFLVAVNRGTMASDPIQRFIVFQLGPVSRWPLALQIATPFLVTATVWILFYPVLAHLGVINWASSKPRILGQGLLLGCALWITLKFLLATVLVLHIASSYVYFGASALWDFIGGTSRNLLRWMPEMRAGKVDLIPVLALLLVCLVFYYPLPQWLGWLIAYLRDQHQIVLWPV